MTVTLIIIVACLSTFTALELAWRVIQLGIAPTPSGPQARALIVELCQQALKERSGPQLVFELGSGWGGLSFKLAQALGPESRVRALELAWAPLLISRLMCYLTSLRSPEQRLKERLSFERRDLTEVTSELKGGELLVCYLCPEQMRRLAESLSAQRLPEQVTLISLLFSLPEHAAQMKVELKNLYRDPIYVYQLS